MIKLETNPYDEFGIFMSRYVSNTCKDTLTSIE